MNMQPRSWEPATPLSGANPRFAIIGAGMSGLLMAIKLTEAGYTDVTVYEKADDLGGTWRENTYPGIACDVPAHHYQYSFAMNPDWGARYPAGHEIQEYLEHVAARHNVGHLIRFNTEIAETRWDGAAWTLTTKAGETIVADVVISATGVLHHPAWPDIPGLKDFKGAMFHTARWDHSVDLKGKRVGIIGTGSTAAQVIPAIAGDVGHLDVFQRTPHWVYPMPQKIYSEREKERLRQHPWLSRLLYNFYWWAMESMFSKVVVGEASGRGRIRAGCMRNLATIKDPELRRKLTPDYEPGCKRLIFSSDLYPALQRSNVALVTDAIAGIEAGGVRTRDGQLHELDVLVLSTGFQPDAFMRPMQVFGEGGVSLAEVWSEGPLAYRAVTIPQMPNFFTMIGPWSPIGNLSLINVAEAQATYVMKCVDAIAAGKVALAPRMDATRRRIAEMKEAVKKTVWVGGCKSWYLDAGGVPNLYPWTPSRFFNEMKQDPDFGDFVMKPLEPARATA